MEPSDIERARAKGERVFYEHATATLRTCPENYCIATRKHGMWRPFVDSALATVGPALEAMVAEFAHDEVARLRRVLTTIVEIHDTLLGGPK